jgi:PAS domain S-box-containing protein
MEKLEGYLEKKGVWGKWKTVYVKLEGSELKIFSRHDARKPKQSITINDTVVQDAERLTKKQYSFGIFGKSKQFVFFQCKSKEEVDRWIRAIQTAGCTQSLSIEDTLENINDAVVMSNREGTIIGFNAAAEQLFGYKKSEMVGQNVKSLMGDDIARKHDRWIDNYHRTGERRLIGIRRIVRGQHKDGNPLDVEISLGELNKEGQTTFIATFRQQKKIEGSSSDVGDEDIVQLKERLRMLETENKLLRGELDLKGALVFSANPTKLFNLGKLLGTGAYGRVHKARFKANNHLVAIKILHSSFDGLVNEVELLKAMAHPNVIQYYGCYQHENTHWIVMEYCKGGAIDSFLKKTSKMLSENALATILIQVLSGLAYIHENGKIHRDVKAANLLLTSYAKIKIADFSIASKLIEDKLKNTIVGTPR